MTPVVPSKTIPVSRPKWAKCMPIFRPKRRTNPTRWPTPAGGFTFTAIWIVAIWYHTYTEIGLPVFFEKIEILFYHTTFLFSKQCIHCNLVPWVLSYPPYGARLCRAGRREPWERGCIHWFPTKELGLRHCSRLVQIPQNQWERRCQFGPIGIFGTSFEGGPIWPVRSSFGIDCEQSLLFFTFSEGSARVRECRAAKPRDARNEGGSSPVSRLQSCA